MFATVLLKLCAKYLKIVFRLRQESLVICDWCISVKMSANWNVSVSCQSVATSVAFRQYMSWPMMYMAKIIQQYHSWFISHFAEGLLSSECFSYLFVLRNFWLCCYMSWKCEVSVGFICHSSLLTRYIVFYKKCSMLLLILIKCFFISMVSWCVSVINSLCFSVTSLEGNTICGMYLSYEI